MTRTRRDFIKISAAAAGGMTLAGFRSTWATPGKADKPLKLLVFGGTGFLGPAVVEYAIQRGHKISIFNRGKTNPELFPEVEKLRGDRDPNKGEGIRALEGKSWDVVIDDTGYFPRTVKASAEAVAASARQYVYVSSISAYAGSSKEKGGESEPLATLEDPTVETMGKSYENYGGLKALCEKAALEAMKGRATIVRPGFIVGPNDRTDRYTWWPVRIARGGEMLAPGSPDDPVQIIDVRDLGAWLVQLAERNTLGTFNAVGPRPANAKPFTVGEMIESCRKATGSDVKPIWVDSTFLMTQLDAEGGAIPIWVPYGGETKGFHTWSNSRAVKAGLTFRDPVDTARDTLAWFRSLPAERQSQMAAGLTTEAEAKVLAAWKKQTATTTAG
jgi:2'-hydroxyisoflavone reductase